MNIKKELSTNKYTKSIYAVLRNAKHAAIHKAEYHRDFNWHGSFDNRQKGSDKLCIVLAGYKTFLYDATMTRLKEYLENDIDVCIITSGLYSDDISSMCQEEGWSYLSTKENNVALVQNVSIKLHPKAEWIYKLDEDIFITNGYFSNMMKAYEFAENGQYNPGVIAPLIPLNGYGHVRILEKVEATKAYKDRFGILKYAAGNEKEIEGNPAVARFMWGDGGIVPTIDEMNERFAAKELEIRACSIRFSIGAILFKREFWEAMGHFTVYKGPGMGLDEVQLCQYCITNSRPIMVSENIVVGHLSFGPQNNSMKDYYYEHPEKFYITQNVKEG